MEGRTLRLTYSIPGQKYCERYALPPGFLTRITSSEAIATVTNSETSYIQSIPLLNDSVTKREIR